MIELQKSTKEYELVITVALKAELPLAWLKENDIPVLTIAGIKAGILNKTQFPLNIVIVLTGVGEEKNGTAISTIINHLKPIYICNIGTCAVKDKNDIGTWFYCTPDMPLAVHPQHHKAASIHSQNTPFKTNDSWPINVTCIDMEMHFQKAAVANHNVLFSSVKYATDSGKEKDFSEALTHVRNSIQELLTPLTYKLSSADITVVIPTYNRATYLPGAIESVIRQTRPPKEIIVIDDGSIDTTPEIMKRYPQITYIHNTDNRGVSAARNTGWKMAKTNWIAFLDSDDEWDKKKLEAQINYLNTHPYYEIIQSQELWIRNGKHLNQKKYHQKQAGFIWNLSLERCMISPSSVLLKKSILEKYNGFDETLPACEDYDLWLKITREHLVGLDTHISLIKYGGHSDQLSAQHSLDKYRIKSLKNQLQKEKMPQYIKKLTALINQKETIYKNGKLKRQS